MRRCLTILAMTLSLPAAAEAPDWKLISRSGQPGQIIHWYVDTGSIVKTDDYLRATLRTSWSRPQIGPDNTPYQSSTYLNYFDCSKRKIAYTGNTYFRSVEPEGDPVHEEPELPLKRLTFQSVVPGSAGALRLDFVCKYKAAQLLTQLRDRKSRA